ncbi:AMP-binding protein [Clostridium akagii]|uniref:AMP-binding protein n=1 Tax=Clostridium akagii TaxID=91623 RepID=UPI00047916EC|nr:AMP-binding protein [Clostridium akagii]
MKDLIQKLRDNEVNTIEYVENKKKRKKTYREMYNDTMNVYKHLEKIGLKIGQKIGLLCKNRYEFIILDLACLYGGYIFVPLNYEIFKNKIERAKTIFDLSFLVADEEINIQNDYIINIKEITKSFNKIPAKELNNLDTQCAFDDNDDYTVILTSGSTGEPKGMYVKLKSPSHFIKTCISKFNFEQDDKVIIFLPLTQFSSRCYYYSAILLGINMCLSIPTTVMFDLQYYKPTVLQGVPYFFESLYETFYSKIKNDEQSYKLYKDFINNKNIIPKHVLRETQKKLFKGIYDFWGGRMKYLITGSAPIRKEVLEFFNDIGIILYEVYGLVETGLITMNYPGYEKIGSVGKVLDDVELILDKDNNIYIRSDYAWARSYINTDDKTNKEMFREDGTLATGDTGHIDKDGFLYLDGRSKDIIVLSNGKKVSPVSLESKINKIDLVKQSVVYGDNHQYIIAVIVKNDEKTSRAEIKEELNKLNVSLNKDAEVHDFIIVNEPFSRENNQITPNMKLNRKKIIATYKIELENLY